MPMKFDVNLNNPTRSEAAFPPPRFPRRVVEKRSKIYQEIIQNSFKMEAPGAHFGMILGVWAALGHHLAWKRILGGVWCGFR